MHPNVSDAERSFLLVVDLQQSYAGQLHEWDRTVERACILIRAAHEVGLPVLYTEQYPRGLGPTTPRVQAALGAAPRFEKRTLSCWGAAGLAEHVTRLDRRQAIVCGIETHACISQTAHELLAQGYRVHLPHDALGSRRLHEHELGFQKLLLSGALPASVESVVLEWVRSADHPKFRAVQALIK
jgi:nicotinamidase-related amidase